MIENFRKKYVAYLLNILIIVLFIFYLLEVYSTRYILDHRVYVKKKGSWHNCELVQTEQLT